MLYLTRAESVPICGYVLTEGSPHQAETTPSATGGKGGSASTWPQTVTKGLTAGMVDEEGLAQGRAPSTPQASTSSGSKEEDVPTRVRKGPLRTLRAALI